MSTGTGASAPILQPLVRKVGERRFIAGVKFGGEWIFSEDKENITAGQARSAVGKLNEKLRAMKARVLLSEEYQMVEPKAAPIAPQHRVVAPAAPKVRAEMPVVAQTEQGWITPRSDKAAWISNYRHAVKACTGLSLEAHKRLHGEAAKQFRADITAVMKSTGCIGPWELTLQDVPWVRVAGMFDPTVAPVRPGTGERRQLRDINGILRDASGEQILEESPFKYLQEEHEAAIAAQMAPKAPPAHPAPTSAYSFGTPDQRKLAADQGRRLIAQAKEGGKDADTQKIWGMIGFVLTLRAMGLPPHAEFERKLRESGVTEEWLQVKSGRAA